MIDFPESPTTGQEHSAGDRTWVFTGIAWRLKSSGSNNLKSISELEPADGDLIQYDGALAGWVVVSKETLLSDLTVDGGTF